jgi:hypothetical protein
MLIAMTVMMMVLGPDRGLFGVISGFDLFVGSIGAILILLFLGQTLATGRRLAALERRP